MTKMRTHTLPIALSVLLASSGLATGLGCSEASSDRKADVTLGDVRQEASEAAGTAASYVDAQAKAQRAALEKQAEKATSELEQQLETARERIAKLPEDARTALQSAIDRAESAQQSAAEELDNAREAGQEQWTTAQKRLSNALAELAEARREVTAALAGETSEAGSPS
jgi:chromosome segregation ATPase